MSRKYQLEDIAIWEDAAYKLSGIDYREFIASVVKRLGYGGQYFAERVLRWNRVTIRKAMLELEAGVFIDHRKSNKGRKRCKEHLPELEDSICAIVEPDVQTDPTFRSTRLHTPLTARQVRRRLISDFSFKNKDLPSIRTISTLLNHLGFTLIKVQQCNPLKKYQKPMRSLID
jgi:hypothetical protein